MQRANPGLACTCPADDQNAVATDCVIHFGVGFGHCVPHAIDADILIGAVVALDGVGLCASCARASRRATKLLSDFRTVGA